MQTNLTQRVRKARKAVQAGVLQKVDGGFRVPSRTQYQHHVVLARFFSTKDEAGYRLTCHYESQHGQWRCPGNQHGHVCWHVLASMIAAAGKRSVAFFEDLDEAKHYKNLGGKLVTVRSGDGSGMLYAVVRENSGKKNGS